MLQSRFDIVEFYVARERPMSEARKGGGRQPHSIVHDLASFSEDDMNATGSGVEP